MIGQTMINVKVPGARTRVSTFLAGVFLMVLCIVFGPVVPDIPMAVVVATSNLAIGVDGTITGHLRQARRPPHQRHLRHRPRQHQRGVLRDRRAVLRLLQRPRRPVRYAKDPDKVVIDLSAAHIWDVSSVATLDAIETKYAQRGKSVEITGLNDPSAGLHGKLSGELTASH